MARTSTPSAASAPGRSGANPPSSPTPVTCFCSFRSRFSAWKISDPARSASENDGQPGGDEHELLDVEPVVGVGAAVDHVHQRKRQRPRVRPAEVPEEREPEVVRGGAGAGERHAEDRVGAQRLLLGRAVELAERAVDQGLLGGVHALELGRDHALHVAHGLEHALAAEAPTVVVAELERLGAARRGARGHRRPALGAAVEMDLDLEGRVPAGVEDLAGVDVDDLGHASVSLLRPADSR